MRLNGLWRALFAGTTVMLSGCGGGTPNDERIGKSDHEMESISNQAPMGGKGEISTA